MTDNINPTNLSPTEEEVANLFAQSLTEDTTTDETTETADTTETTDTDTPNNLEDTAEDETVEDTDTDSDTDADDSDNDTDSEDDTADPDDDGLIKYEINGKEYSFTQEEFLEAHQNGLRQADYSKKTAELAEQRKAFEVEKEEAIKSRQAELDKLLANAKDIAGTERKSPEELAQLAKDDPYSYNALKAQYDAEDQLIAYKQQQEQAKLSEVAQAETAKLVEMVPAFKEDFDGTYKETINYMVENGVDEGTAKSLINAPLVKMIYDGMVANKGVSKNKVKIVPKTVANKKAPQLDANKKRAAALKNANSIESIGSLIEADFS